VHHTLPQIIVYAGERHPAVDQDWPHWQPVVCRSISAPDLVRICLIKLKLSNGTVSACPPSQSSRCPC
jgi:hypothetical protein